MLSGEGNLVRERDRLSGGVAPEGLGAKRAFDVIAATTGLTLLSPLVLVVSVAIKLDSRGPVFVRQTEYGYNNRLIHVIKFRSRQFAQKQIASIRM
jgi:lipopolysaccharide/colanic/teichoic acid biosynthesis glycosyltransferase